MLVDLDAGQRGKEVGWKEANATRLLCAELCKEVRLLSVDASIRGLGRKGDYEFKWGSISIHTQGFALIGGLFGKGTRLVR